MKIFDCFMFYDEEMLLDIRLNTLDKFIDKFIIVESMFTHSGKKRELIFDIKKYSKFKDKISYMVLDEEPEDLFKIDGQEEFDKKNSKYILNALKRENFQRNYISQGLQNASSDDIVIISDVDEIPKLSNIDIKKVNQKIILFKQDMMYYKFNLKLENFIWVGTRACQMKNLESPQWLRNIKDKSYPWWRLDTLFSKNKYQNIKFIDNGGWHFSYLKTPEEIEKKANDE